MGEQLDAGGVPMEEHEVVGIGIMEKLDQMITLLSSINEHLRNIKYNTR